MSDRIYDDDYNDNYNKRISIRERWFLDENYSSVQLGLLPDKPQYYDKNAYILVYRYATNRLEAAKEDVNKDLIIVHKKSCEEKFRQKKRKREIARERFELAQSIFSILFAIGLPIGLLLLLLMLSSSPDKTVYITSTGEMYHDSKCICLHNSKIPISKKSARSKGYSECSLCNP